MPGRDQEHLRPAGHSRGRKEVPGRREGPVRERSGLRFAEGRDGQAGRDLHRHRLGRPRTSRPGAPVFRHDHPAGRQQVRRPELGRLVRRVVRLRAAGREGRIPLAGLFPHQRRQHGPVRADADHRRRGCPGALRRGLHGPDVLDRKPPLGRGRGDRQTRLAGPLHDDPELGQQHLQPGHQAGDGLRRLAGRVGRRQPGQPADDEVPLDLPDGAGRPRRGPLGGLRLGRPAPGRRRQGRPLRPAHVQPHHLEVDLARTAAGPATAAWCGCARGPSSRNPASSATP